MNLRPMLALVVLASCSAPEIRIGADQGIPAVTGATEVDGLDTFVCGMPIQSGEYTIATKVVGADCELTFNQDVVIVRQEDYAQIPDLKGTSNLVQAVDLEVKKLAFVDVATGQPLDLNTRITSCTLSINGQLVANKESIAQLPITVRLQGDALTPIKAKVDARQPASVRATSVVVLKQMPKSPAKLKIDYDAQPTLVLGTGSISL